MMTSSNGNIFRVTGHLYGEFTGPRWIPAQRPVTQSFDVFFDLHPNKWLGKQWWGWWFETPWCPLWRHRNVYVDEITYSCLRRMWVNKPYESANYHNGPLIRYVKVMVAHALGMPGKFSLPPLGCNPGIHHGTCVTHVPWCMPGSLLSGFFRSRWRGKRSRHSRRMCNPQFDVSGKRPMQL